MTPLQWKVVSLLRCNLPTPPRNSPGASADAIWAVTDTWLESEIWSCTLMNVVYRRAADGPNPPTWRDLFPRTQMRPAGVFPQRPIGSARPLCRRAVCCIDASSWLSWMHPTVRHWISIRFLISPLCLALFLGYCFSLRSADPVVACLTMLYATQTIMRNEYFCAMQRC